MIFMKKVLTFISALIILQTLSGQHTIRGVVHDAFTKGKIEGALITPVLFGDTVFTDGAGKFKIKIPKAYREAITYSHPNYYPFKEMIKGGSAMHPHLVYLTPRTVQLDTIFFLDDKANHRVMVNVIDKGGPEPVYKAAVRLEDNKIVAYTDFEGIAKVVVPRSLHKLLVSHPDYSQQEVVLKNNGPHQDGGKVMLKKINIRPADTLWKTKRNSISWAPGELLSGSVGLRYERFLGTKNSIGVHASMYLFGFVFRPLNENASRFRGIKLAPFYRYYLNRTKSRGYFVEVKPIVGYFNFYKLAINNPNESGTLFTTQAQFWTAGIAAAIGVMILPGGGPVNINLSLGFQYFPIRIDPLSNPQHPSTKYEYSSEWWYWGGPGSIVEFKFTIGGIF